MISRRIAARRNRARGLSLKYTASEPAQPIKTITKHAPRNANSKFNRQ